MSAADARPDLSSRLRAPDAAAVGCKVCGAPAPLFGVVDFNKSCEDLRHPPLTLSGVPIYYRRCTGCGLVFTDAFDDWAQADFEAHIYNADYVEIDPDYVEARPDGLSAMVTQVFGPMAADLRVLDYGGGNGRFAGTLRAAGFRCETYDPFTPAFQTRPEGRFNIVTCFETLEHMPRPGEGVSDLAAFLEEPGLVLFTTLLQDSDFEKQGVGWWYLGPRNGHVTLFSKPALTHLWADLGMTVASLDENFHFAFRGDPPAFAEPFLAAASA